MPRHDAHPAPEGWGYLLDGQIDLPDGLNTRVMVPLMPGDEAPEPARLLNLVFEVEDERHVMTAYFMSAVPQGVLRPPVADLSARSEEITRALDMLFQGFQGIEPLRIWAGAGRS